MSLAGLALAASPAAACELRVRWNPDPPYTLRDEAGHIVGLQAELTEQTLQRMGCKAVWVELPWARALVELQAGRLDVLPGALRRPEREAYAYWAEQHVAVANRLFVRAGRETDFGSATRLQEAWRPGFKLGVQIGVVYGPAYAELLGNAAFRATLTQASGRRSLWQMLDIGRVDGVLASEATARWELGELGLTGRIVPTAVVISHEPAQTMFSKRSVDAAQVQRYREAAEALEKDGTQARIVRKYLGGD
ncbi:polar amino acid transport system substrate-binding protein [Pelomonas saccharophila]|uniref:Polar amino acid transport system substrate-binding protein n=1 Tax=Roseateles saccharophilus TaxID=304 RepID=A0ABU1YMG9_ROSSA|nr:transporter substrate-binding domain-containing protein [Roseateles saccharophilus]MDR7269938.1 polar amino acid transport system substrate-binding protein [Roseateles saccharophilus]